MQATQTAACNRVHDISERLARWLLMCRDRQEDDSIGLTQEFLSDMLGSRRSTVTLAVGMLQQAGLIRSARGCVQILDRAGLENAACECYAAINSQVSKWHGQQSAH
jgi:CRP-like cAMP-binding protein